MTATRRQPVVYLSGVEAARPDPSTVQDQIYIARDTGNSFYGDGLTWTLCSVVSPAGPGDVMNYDTANLTQFSSVQLKNSWSLTFDNARTRHGAGFSGRFQIRQGDIPLTDGHERAEILGPSWVEGDDKWYGWSTWFPDAGVGTATLNPTDTVSTGVTNIFTQIHEARATGAPSDPAAVPPVRVSVNTNTFTYPFHWACSVAGGTLDSGGFPVSGVTQYDLGTVLYNQWVDFIMHVKHSSSASTGRFEIFVNGVSKTGGPVTCATLFPGQKNYFKQGYYRTNQALTTDIWHDETMAGASYAEVDPST